MYLAEESDNRLAQIEAAMVAIRRRQNRRVLARQAGVPDTALFEVLDVVEAAEGTGQPAGVTAIATVLGVAQPRASKLVADAVTAGLIRREADQADGRRAQLVRTEAGRALSEQVHRSRREALAAVMSDWPEQDLDEFARLLTRFVTDGR